MKNKEIRVDNVIIKYPRLFIPIPDGAIEEKYYVEKFPLTEFKKLVYKAAFLVPKSNTDFLNTVETVAKEILKEKRDKLTDDRLRKSFDLKEIKKKDGGRNFLIKDGDVKYHDDPTTYEDYKGMWVFNLKNIFRGVGKLENVPSVYFTDKDKDGEEVIRPLVYEKLTDSDISPVQKNYSKLPFSCYIFHGAKVNLKFSLWAWINSGNVGVSGSIKAVRSLDYNEDNYGFSNDVGVDRYINDI